MQEIAVIVLLVIILLFLVSCKTNMVGSAPESYTAEPTELLEITSAVSIHIYTDGSYITSTNSTRRKLPDRMMKSVEYILTQAPLFTNCGTNCACTVCSGSNGVVDTFWKTYTVRGRGQHIGSMTRGQLAELEKIYVQLRYA